MQIHNRIALKKCKNRFFALIIEIVASQVKKQGTEAKSTDFASVHIYLDFLKSSF